MNARSFLGNDKINELAAQGMSANQIYDYAKSEWQKTRQTQTTQERATGQNSGLDGKPIPSAPIEKAGERTQQTGFFSGLGNELKRIGNAIIEDSFFGDYGTGASEADKIKSDVARAQNTQGIVKTFIQDGEEERANNQRLAQTYDDLAKKRGYDLGAIVEGNKIYFGKRGENGEILTLDATPEFKNTILANKGEIAGGVAGGLMPGGLLAKAIYSAAGTGAGAGADYANRAQNLDENLDTKELLARAEEGAVDDLLGAAAIGGAIKGAKLAYEPTKKALGAAGDLAVKAYDYFPTTLVQKHILTDNVDGAARQLNRTLGGDVATQTALNNARQALGDGAYKQIAEDKNFKIPLTKNDRINTAINYVNEKIAEPLQNMARSVLRTQGIAEKDADMLLTALGSKDGAKIITGAIAKDPQGFADAHRIFMNLNKSQKAQLDEIFTDVPNVTEVLKGYEKRVKTNYGEAMDVLDKAFNADGLNLDVLRLELGSRLQKIIGKSSVDYKLIMDEIAKERGFKGIKEARNLINSEIDAMNRGGAADAASRIRTLVLQSARDVIDGAIDDIFNQYEKINPRLGAQARQLIDVANKEYAPLKQIQKSALFKTISKDGKTAKELTDALIKSADNQTGMNLDEILSSVSVADRATIESGLFKNVIDGFSKDGITDFKSALDMLEKLPFKSERVTDVLNELKQNSAVLNNTSEILETMRGMTPKSAELQQGIGTSPLSAFKTMGRNRLVNKLKSKLPYLGDNQALKNHIITALKNTDDLKTTIKNISEIPAQNLNTAAKKETERFKNEALPEIEKIIKQSKPNFTMKDGGIRFLDEAKFKTSKEIQDRGNLGDTIVTSLTWLQKRHPEMFENKRAVKKLIDYIIENPDKIKDATTKNSVFMDRRDGRKIKDIVVNRDNNKIIHANERKLKASEKAELASEDALHSHTDTKPAGALTLGHEARLANSYGVNVPKKDKNKLKIEFSNLEKQLIEAAPAAKEILEKAKVKEAKINYALKRIKEILEAK